MTIAVGKSAGSEATPSRPPRSSTVCRGRLDESAKSASTLSDEPRPPSRATRCGRGAGSVDPPSGRERGVALVVVLLVAAVLAMLGLGLMGLAALETDAARHELAARQAGFAAEAGLAAVKHWFDAPVGASGAFCVPTVDEVDRSQRRVDPEGDGTYAPAASGSARWNSLYRQGRDDLFERPYRGDPALALEGDASGPDVLLSRASTSSRAVAFLDRLAASLLGPGGDGSAGRFRLRFDRIAVFGPPRPRIAGVATRMGIATIEITASAVRSFEGTDEVLATAQARGVLQEVPYALPGPLSAGAIAEGSGLDVRWGTVRVAGDAAFASGASAAARGGWPWRSVSRRLVLDADGDGTADDTDADGAPDLTEWLSLPDATLEDPWFRLLVGGTIARAPAAVQPWPFDPASIAGAFTTDDDRSGVFQHLTMPVPSAPDARALRAAAAGGGPAAHLLRYVAGTDPPLFRESAGAPPRSLESITNGAAGLFYFDTTDGRPSADDDRDGTPDNLTPAIAIADPTWSCAGCLIVNARSFALPASSLPARVEMVPPGEPFADLDGDGTCSAGESYLRLDCPPDLLAPGASCTRLQITSAAAGALPRRTAGAPFVSDATFFGVLIVAGDWVGAGPARIYGAAAVAGAVSVPPGAGGPRLQIVFDSRLAQDKWPPPDLPIPRTVWQGQSIPP